ncbi:MAG: penicillin-binding protein 2 [Patescibacteria group bacterium]
MRRTLIVRLRIIAAVLITVALILVAKLYYISVVEHDAYLAKAENQLGGATQEMLERGDIFFTEKSGSRAAAALVQTAYNVNLNLTILKNADTVYTALNAITPIDSELFKRAVAKINDPHETVAKHVSREVVEKINALKIIGVSTSPERLRIYPGRTHGAHVLGFVGYKADRRVGRAGLERYWEDKISKKNEGPNKSFFADLLVNAVALGGGDANGQGADLITAIEPTVEQRLEEILASVAETYSPKIVGGVILDPKTGAVLAMAAYPTFDPNAYGSVTDPGVFSNPMVEGLYEFGSTMKPLTMLAGIDSKAVTSTTEYTDTGVIVRDGARVSNYDGRARGRVPMQEVLSQSLNTGAAFVAEQMGIETFARYFTSFGLGEETGIDLPGEVPGLLSALQSGSALDLASASFGQGIAVTPIAMTRALGALANHGVIVNPHVVDQFYYPSGVHHRAWQEGDRRVVSAESADTVTRMLVKVVDDALLQGKLKMEHYSIAAKTGTAQIAVAGGGYYPDRYLHSFFGYFPAHDARFLIFLFTVEPKGVTYASQTLAEPFGELARFLISYYDVPPDR